MPQEQPIEPVHALLTLFGQHVGQLVFAHHHLLRDAVDVVFVRLVCNEHACLCQHLVGCEQLVSAPERDGIERRGLALVFDRQVNCRNDELHRVHLVVGELVRRGKRLLQVFGRIAVGVMQLQRFDIGLAAPIVPDFPEVVVQIGNMVRCGEQARLRGEVRRDLHQVVGDDTYLLPALLQDQAMAHQVAMDTVRQAVPGRETGQDGAVGGGYLCNPIVAEIFTFRRAGKERRQQQAGCPELCDNPFHR